MLLEHRDSTGNRTNAIRVGRWTSGAAPGFDDDASHRLESSVTHIVVLGLNTPSMFAVEARPLKRRRPSKYRNTFSIVGCQGPFRVRWGSCDCYLLPQP